MMCCCELLISYCWHDICELYQDGWRSSPVFGTLHQLWLWWLVIVG